MDTLSELRAGRLAGIRRLDLSCGLEAFPREIFALADSLEILNLSGNQLHSLPDDLPRLHRLRVVFCSDNRFTRLPPVLGRCAALEMVGFKANRITELPAEALPPLLRWLILTDNALAEVPAELGRRPRLQKLMLAGNRLRSLPPELAACKRLELLRISANRFESLPPWLAELPRLAWLAPAGNPCGERQETRAAAQDIPVIDWSTLEPGPVLGEGASGVIRRAVWTDGGRREPVAVKLFKGAVTSDGLPRSEMAACIAAGTHTNLIGAIGRIGGHPDGTQGLVMPLVDPTFSVLAGPPSLASCTRDVYADGLRLRGDVALRIARDIAAAVAHLHARGLLHGDLYAHNILRNPRGDALLGDFGAASFLDTADLEQAEALQRTEVRAFGCLLEELAALCEDDAVRQALADLSARCTTDDIAARPLLPAVLAALSALP